jgi:hypothetical protein
MKRFTLIEEDRYIRIDETGIFFEEDNWISPEIEGLWAIQWKDDGTLEGDGWIEYNTPIPNKKCVRGDFDKYISHFEKEHNRQMELRSTQEELEKQHAISWQEAMKELEEQMEEMQNRHVETLEEMNKDHISVNLVMKIKEEYENQIEKLHNQHTETLEEMNRDHISVNLAMKIKEEYENQIEKLHNQHTESLRMIEEEHDQQIKKIHEHVAEAHENFFYATDIIQDNIEESKDAFQAETGYNNFTIFDGNVDPSLFDDVVDESHFSEETEFSDDSLVDALDDYSSIKDEEAIKKDEIKSFSDIDLSVLDSEFNLELLFDEDPTEQVVNEIEELIEKEENSEEVPDAEVPDNK